MDSGFDVAVIGAGPAGAVAAALLARRGWRVCVMEQSRFPRFSIGESLLPQSMAFLEQAGMLDAVQAAGFQTKNGAAFRQGERSQALRFEEKSATGWFETFEVTRADFDRILADQAAAAGAEIFFETRVEAFDHDGGRSCLRVRDRNGGERDIHAPLVLDASGFGRVLSRLLDLEKPSGFPRRTSLFRHLADHIDRPDFDRNKILISIHPGNADIWYWLIPLAGGVSSVGVVGQAADIDAAGDTDDSRFAALVAQSGHMADLLAKASPVRDVGRLSGYSASVSALTGPGWVLLGNAAEFLDPVFSSGVTIALKSATLAAEAADRQLSGQAVDWDRDYQQPLMGGVETFRAFVEAWYTGQLQRIIMNQPAETNRLKQMIISILAGYVWDQENLFVRNPKRYLALVDELC